MYKSKKTLLSLTLATVITLGLFTAKPVKAASIDDALYLSAYTVTQNAMTSKTQASINAARAQIAVLPETLEWAKPEFSKQLDIVQTELMDNAIKAYYKALDTVDPEDIDKVKDILSEIGTSDDQSIRSWSNSLVGQVAYICYTHALNDMSKTLYSLPNVYNSLKDTKSLKVAFWGDSITEGANNAPEDTYPELFIDALKTAIPDISVEHTNFSLGSRNSYNAVDDTYKANNPEHPFVAPNPSIDFWRDWSIQGESWKQHVADYKPDLLFIAFGMNDVRDNSLTDYNYISNISSMVNYIKANSPKTDIVLVSNIMPTENKSLYNQSSTRTLQVARATREYAKLNNIPLIDANRLWSTLLYGKDEDGYAAQEITGIDNIENTIAYNSELQFSIDKVSNNAEDTKIALRSDSQNGGILFSLTNKNGTDYIDIYTMDSGADKAGVFIGTAVAEDVNDIKLEGAKITVNGISFNSYKHLKEGAILFPEGKKNISSIKFIKETNLTEAPLYREQDMLGYVNGGTSGNGINHPTALGTSLSYYAACGVLIDSVKAEYNNIPKSTEEPSEENDGAVTPSQNTDNGASEKANTETSQNKADNTNSQSNSNKTQQTGKPQVNK